MLNSFTELLLPDNRTNSFLFDSDLNKTKPFGQDSFELTRNTEGKYFNLVSVYSYLINMFFHALEECSIASLIYMQLLFVSQST